MKSSKSKVFVGAVIKSNCGSYFTVTERVEGRKYLVRFNDSGYEKVCYSSCISRGKVKDPNSRVIAGVGFIGCGEYKAISKHGGVEKSYQCWKDMIIRCYDESLRHKHPTYKYCTVCPEWQNFQNFAEWFYDNYPDDGNCYHLDKDLKVIGNKIYSPETCMFVSPVVNSFIGTGGSNSSNLMIGVSKSQSGKKFCAFCRDVEANKTKRLGTFPSEIEAHVAWRKAKSKGAQYLASIQTNVEVRDAILRWKDAIDNETIYPYRKQ